MTTESEAEEFIRRAKLEASEAVISELLHAKFIINRQLEIMNAKLQKATETERPHMIKVIKRYEGLKEHIDREVEYISEDALHLMNKHNIDYLIAGLGIIKRSRFSHYLISNTTGLETQFLEAMWGGA